MTKLYLMHWTEYEAGWGSRPDGYTIYPSASDAQKHIRDFLNQKQSYECFSKPSWSACKVIEMKTPVDFKEQTVLWLSNKDLNGEEWKRIENGKEIVVQEVKPKYEYLVYPNETVAI